MYEAVKAANPATRPPTKAVMKASSTGLSPIPSIPPTLFANILPFAALISEAIISHSRKIAMKPDKKEDPGLCATHRETTNATTAILHQGAYKPVTNDKIAMEKSIIKNFIVT